MNTSIFGFATAAESSVTATTVLWGNAMATMLKNKKVRDTTFQVGFIGGILILFTVDQLTSFVLKSYGGAVCKTPNIDALAARGTVFENTYCAHPDEAHPTRLAEETWPLDTLMNDVIRSQTECKLIDTALAIGREEIWDFTPRPLTQNTSYARRGDAFPTVERRGYLSYPSNKQGNI